MKITYYTDGKSEILLIQDSNGKTVKKGRYTIGNCLIDILFGKKDWSKTAYWKDGYRDLKKVSYFDD